ncbi:hypothetical protein ACUOAQ_13580, partial [Escherichia sp. SP-MK]
MADKKLDTQLVNAGRSKKYTLGAVNSVIQRASSLVFDSVEAKKHATRNRAESVFFAASCIHQLSIKLFVRHVG